MYLLSPEIDDGRQRAMAKADAGSVASVGDNPVIINMPHFGDIVTNAGGKASDPSRPLLSVTPEYLLGLFGEHTSIQANKLIEGVHRKVDQSIWHRIQRPFAAGGPDTLVQFSGV